MKINKQYKIIKATKKSIVGAIFEYVIINKGESVQPKWFTNWANAFKKENDAQWAKNDAQWVKNDERWQKQEEFNKYVSEFIKQQLEFNKMVMDVFKRNNLK